MNVHTRHARCTRPAYGTREHFDWSASGDSLRELEPAEHIQRDAWTVIRSIDRADRLWTAFLFVSAFAGIGLFFAIGGKP
jgi:hypothetical protein